MEKKHILIVCGEASGDLNAGLLAKNILEIVPQIKISAVGGTQLANAGAKIIYDIKGLSVMGLFDVLRKLPDFFSLKKLILKKIASEKIDALILVDFSGFNLRLARALNNKIPVIYYVSPQVWASRPGRIKTIKKYVSKMIVLFKFEEEFYKKHGIAADFTGSPLIDAVKPSMDKKEFLNNFKLRENQKIITLLPGSRACEIKNILPIMLDSCVLLSQALTECQFIIAKSPQLDWQALHRITHNYKINLKVVEGKAYDCINASDFCLVASGTATLETAIMQKPFVIIYKMSLLNYLLYRPQVNLKVIGMANIIAGRKIIPEFIQFQAEPKKISQQVLQILNDPKMMDEIKSGLKEVNARLGLPGSSERAARIISDFLRPS